MLQIRDCLGSSRTVGTYVPSTKQVLALPFHNGSQKLFDYVANDGEADPK